MGNLQDTTSRPAPEIEEEPVTRQETGVLDAKPAVEEQYLQEGVQQIEAITQVWTRTTIIITFIIIYLIMFVLNMLQSIQSNLNAFVTSSFSAHGLLSTVSIVSTIMGGVSKLTIAKIIDVWGRVQGFCFMLLLVTVGMIMKAVCKNIETYAAAQTFYWVGHLGMLYILSIVIADMTTLRNRMLIVGISETPIIATVFAGPKIAELYYLHLNFRWAFGSWVIILIGFCIPLLAIFVLQTQKAKRFGLYPQKPSDRTYWQAAKHYFVEFDVVGILLTTGGFSLLLLPFSLATSAPYGWRTAYIIAMFVTGGVCLILFALWERYAAPVQYLPWKYLLERNIVSASLLYLFMFASIFCWDTYYYSYLIVVNNQSITTAGYILNSLSLGSSFLMPFVGILMRYVGSYKYVAMCGIPFTVLGTALLIKFRTPDSGVGYLVMCQLLNGFGCAFFVLTSQMAIMAPVTHQEIAVVLAIYGMFGSIGASIGESIAGALWTNDLPKALYNALPDDSKDLAATIYLSIETQLSYPLGSPVREAIITAYGSVMHKMVIAGSVFIVPMVLCIFVWRNINIKTIEKEHGTQSKGNIW